MPDELEEDPPPDQIRDAREIAVRALTLFAVVGLALHTPKDEAVEWLRRESLWSELSPQELAFFNAAEPSERQRINASWRSEALLILLWSLGLVDELPALNVQCGAARFQDIMPPFAEVTVAEFISRARRRSDDELLDMADALLNSHWQVRDARYHHRPEPEHLDIGIIQERHHAINWVIGYDGSPWDEVTTDT